jgi:hypothetical protein
LRDRLAKAEKRDGRINWDIIEGRVKEGKITELDWRILQRIRTGAPRLPLSERGKYWRKKADELTRAMGMFTESIIGRPPRKRRRR